MAPAPANGFYPFTEAIFSKGLAYGKRPVRQAGSPRERSHA